VSQCVTWDGDSYRSNVEHHRRHSPYEIRNLVLKPGEAILDLGCGVGDYAKSLADRFDGSHVVGLDSSSEMVAIAREFENANLRFKAGRAQDLEDEDAYDYVVSTACLHWISREDHPQLLRGIHRALRRNGKMIVEFGAAGNVRQTLETIEEAVADRTESATDISTSNPWYFPTAKEYESMMGDSPFQRYQVMARSQIRTFSEVEFEGWLRSQVLLPWVQQIPVAHRGELADQLVARALEASRIRPGVCEENFVRLVVTASK